MGDAMLIILMAIINFSRMKVHAVTRWLWLALSGGMFVAAPSGCEKDCNCHCECGQPSATLPASVDRADAVAVQDATQVTPNSRATGADAKAARAKGAGDVVNADPGTTPAPAQTVTTKKPLKKPADPPKEPEKIVVPDVPQVAYGPPPVLDSPGVIQPLYGMPVDRDRMPQIMYGPPSNLDLKNSD